MNSFIVRKGIVALFGLVVIQKGASSGADFHWGYIDWAGRSRERVLKKSARIGLINQKLL